MSASLLINRHHKYFGQKGDLVHQRAYLNYFSKTPEGASQQAVFYTRLKYGEITKELGKMFQNMEKYANCTKNLLMKRLRMMVIKRSSKKS